MNTFRLVKTFFRKAAVFFVCMTAGFSTWADQDAQKMILSILKADDFDLDISKLPKALQKDWPIPETNEEFDRLMKKPGFEIFKFPTKNQFEDQFTYYIFFRSSTREFWIWRVGGVAMSSAFFGPGSLPSELPAEQGAAANP